MGSVGGIILTGEIRITQKPVSVKLRPPQIPLVLIPKLRSENLSHRTAQSEGHNLCTLYAVQTEVAHVIEQRQFWEEKQLLCERYYDVCC